MRARFPIPVLVVSVVLVVPLGSIACDKCKDSGLVEVVETRAEAFDKPSAARDAANRLNQAEWDQLNAQVQRQLEAGGAGGAIGKPAWEIYDRGDDTYGLRRSAPIVRYCSCEKGRERRRQDAEAKQRGSAESLQQEREKAKADLPEIARRLKACKDASEKLGREAASLDADVQKYDAATAKLNEAIENLHGLMRSARGDGLTQLQEQEVALYDKLNAAKQSRGIAAIKRNQLESAMRRAKDDLADVREWLARWSKDEVLAPSVKQIESQPSGGQAEQQPAEGVPVKIIVLNDGTEIVAKAFLKEGVNATCTLLDGSTRQVPYDAIKSIRNETRKKETK